MTPFLFLLQWFHQPNRCLHATLSSLFSEFRLFCVVGFFLVAAAVFQTKDKNLPSQGLNESPKLESFLLNHFFRSSQPQHQSQQSLARFRFPLLVGGGPTGGITLRGHAAASAASVGARAGRRTIASGTLASSKHTTPSGTIRRRNWTSVSYGLEQQDASPG